MPPSLRAASAPEQPDGVGQEIPGGGLVGMTRGLMEVGTARLVVSLWSVEDHRRPSWIGRFYRGMIRGELRPAAALQRRVEDVTPTAATIYVLALVGAFAMGRTGGGDGSGLPSLSGSGEDRLSGPRSSLAQGPGPTGVRRAQHRRGTYPLSGSDPALALLEGYFDLAPEIYGDPGRLAARLELRLSTLMPVNGVTAMMELCGAALAFRERISDALAVFRAHAGLDLADAAEPMRYGPALRARLERLPDELAGTYVGPSRRLSKRTATRDSRWPCSENTPIFDLKTIAASKPGGPPVAAPGPVDRECGASIGGLWSRGRSGRLGGPPAYGSGRSPALPGPGDRRPRRLVPLRHRACHRGGENTHGCLWDGCGCNLRGEDWLWLVSCSIGQLGQNGDRDVEGFCVRLAPHRARSVAAFRWPVHAIEAAALTNEAVRACIWKLTQPEMEFQPAACGLCPERCKKKFFRGWCTSSSHSHVGLNIAAACELFGLG